MANTNTPYSFRYWDRGDTAVATVREAETLSNVSLKAGDAVQYDNDGLLIRQVNETSALLGFAQHDLTGETGVRKKVLYYPADNDSRFVGRSTGTTNVTRAMRGKSYVIDGASGEMGINTGTTTEGCVTIDDLKPGSTWGTYAELIFRVKKSQLTGQA